MIYPSTFPSDRSGESAERTMFDAFSKLPPNDFDTFYNTDISGRNRGENLDYEVDFIVADIRNGRLNGIVCIEVKGGLLRYDSNEGWSQNGRHMNRPPTQQVMAVMHNLVDRFPEVSRYVPFGWMLCFPGGQSPGEDHLPLALNEVQVIDKQKIPFLKETMLSYFDWLNQMHDNRNGLNLQGYDRHFKATLVKSCDFVLSLSARISGDEQTFIKLTQQQAKLIRSAKDNKRILATGTAGSGKTIIAKEIAQEFFEKGMNVLFLCYNSVLAANIGYYFANEKAVRISSFVNNLIYSEENQRIDPEKIVRYLEEEKLANETKTNLRVDTYHSFASSLISKVDPAWWHENFNSRNFWSFDISEKIEQIANSGGIENLYDVVIIDEGQDFMEYWHESINYILAPGGRRYIFMDEDQNINQALSRVPDVEGYSRSNLDENCRNTKNIAEKLSDILKQKIHSMEGIPEGDPVQIISYRSDTEQQTLILKEIRSLLGKEKVSPNDILILMNTTKDGSCLAGTKAIDSLPLVLLGNNGVLRDNAINYTHIKTFKGLEANIVFIIDTDKAPYNQQVLYTQASRSKHLLYIFEKQ